MKGTVFAGIILLIYSGISLGILIRFLEEKKYCLIIFAPCIPILVLIFNIRYLGRIIFKSKKKICNRFKLFNSMVYIMIRYYNILIQFNVNVFVKSSLNSKIQETIRNFAHEDKLFLKGEYFRNLYNTNTNFMTNGLKVSYHME